MVPGGDGDEGGRARAAVEVLVGAADGQVDAEAVEVDGQDADGVRQVGHHHRAGGVCTLDDRGEVPPLAGAEVDGGHGHDGGVGVRGHRVRRRGDERQPRQARHRRREVAVGGEVAGVGEQHRAPRPEPGRGDQRPEELHRRRVADHRLPGCGADQRAHPVAEALRRRPPAAVLPARDPDPRPLLVHRGEHRVPRGAGLGAQGVAGEVDRVAAVGGAREDEGVAREAGLRRTVRGHGSCSWRRGRRPCRPPRASGSSAPRRRGSRRCRHSP